MAQTRVTTSFCRCEHDKILRMKKIIYYISFSFLPNNTKVMIKCVSWILFQVLTVGCFINKVSLEKWLWNVYLDLNEDKEWRAK